MKFYKKLSKIMDENGFSVSMLADKLGVNVSVIYTWKFTNSIPNFSTAIKVVELFDCSLDYLFGNVDEDFGVKFKKCLPFCEIFANNLKTYKITQYRLVKDGICSFSNISNYLKGKSDPNMKTVIKLAEYFNLSLDEFVGRV